MLETSPPTDEGLSKSSSNGHHCSYLRESSLRCSESVPVKASGDYYHLFPHHHSLGSDEGHY